MSGYIHCVRVCALHGRHCSEEDYEVLQDEELVAWWREVKDVGFPGYNWGDLYEIDDVPELQFALTTIMWTCGPQSSALSQSMCDAYAFPPNRPTAIRGKPHKRGVIGGGWYRLRSFDLTRGA